MDDHVSNVYVDMGSFSTGQIPILINCVLHTPKIATVL